MLNYTALICSSADSVHSAYEIQVYINLIWFPFKKKHWMRKIAARESVLHNLTCKNHAHRNILKATRMFGQIVWGIKLIHNLKT